MNNKYIKTLIFLACTIAVFVGLGILNQPRNLDQDTIRDAVESMLKLDELLAKQKIGWGDVDGQYFGELDKVVADTDRFIEDVRLHRKIRDAIKAGKKDISPRLQGIIIRRTLLRACLYHIEALLTPKIEPEISLPATEKQWRIEALMQLVFKFVENESPVYLDGLHKRLDHWKESGQLADGEKFIEYVKGIVAKTILIRMNQWRKLNKKTKEGRFNSIVYQAEMRQLFHYLYPDHAAYNKKKAWKILTEFTNNPDDVDDRFISEGVAEAFKEQIKLVEENS